MLPSHVVSLPLIERALSQLNDVVLITEAEPVDLPGPRVVYVNEAFERMSGFSASEIIGLTPRILQGPRTARSELDRLRHALERWQSCRVTVTNYRKDGCPFDVEFDVVPVADESGRYTHWVSLQRDTTMQSVAATIIAQADTVDALVSGVLRELVEYADVDGACWQLRESEADAWHVTHAVVRDRSTDVYVHGREGIPHDLAARDVVIGALPLRGEARARLILWTHEGAVPAHAAALAGAVAVRSVISYERLRADSARGQLEHRLRQAQKLESIGQLAGGVAHDFNNLLTIITGNLELLRDRVKPDDSGYDEIDELLRATERGRSLVQHLLAFSQRQPVALRELDIKRVIGETLVLLSRSLGSQITITADIPEGLPRVTGDGAFLERVLINLAVNSRDAILSDCGNPAGSSCGSINIRVDSVELSDVSRVTWEDLASGRYLCLSVEDDGPGMSADVRARAFDPFFTTKAIGSGSGLGLSSVYGAVAQMGGGVRLSEGAAGGLLVSIMLPVRAKPA